MLVEGFLFVRSIASSTWSTPVSHLFIHLHNISFFYISAPVLNMRLFEADDVSTWQPTRRYVTDHVTLNAEEHKIFGCEVGLLSLIHSDWIKSWLSVDRESFTHSLIHLLAYSLTHPLTLPTGGVLALIYITPFHTSLSNLKRSRVKSLTFSNFTVQWQQLTEAECRICLS